MAQHNPYRYCNTTGHGLCASTSACIEQEKTTCAQLTPIQCQNSATCNVQGSGCIVNANIQQPTCKCTEGTDTECATSTDAACYFGNFPIYNSAAGEYICN
jgi:hypothetical protein